MRMIARKRNRVPNLLIIGIPIILLLLILYVIFSGRTASVEIIEEEIEVPNAKIIDQIKIAAEQVLGDEGSIEEFKIGKVEFSHIDEDDQQVFLLTYSMKPKDPENYILIGGGVEGQDGWIHEKTKFVTMTQKSFIFSDNPTAGD